MQITILKSDSFETKSWSGGKTTQLFIWPENADYQKRDFLFRLSTATVEVEESEFTQLPGISRKIMILEGETRLEHNGHYTKLLKPFEQDAFEGDWETRSYGKCTDFNLMTSDSCTGKINFLEIETEQNFFYKIQLGADFILIYVYTGSVLINNERLDKKDIYVCQNPEINGLLIEGIEDCVMVICMLEC